MKNKKSFDKILRLFNENRRKRSFDDIDNNVLFRGLHLLDVSSSLSLSEVNKNRFYQKNLQAFTDSEKIFPDNSSEESIEIDRLKKLLVEKCEYCQSYESSDNNSQLQNHENKQRNQPFPIQQRLFEFDSSQFWYCYSFSISSEGSLIMLHKGLQ